MALSPIVSGPTISLEFQLPKTTNEVWQLAKETSLKSFSGREYPRLNFESKVHKFLRKKLCDIAWADAIWQQFEKHLLHLLREDPVLEGQINNWLKLNCYNLGCAKLPFLAEMRGKLPSHLHAAWDLFIRGISCLEHSHESDLLSKTEKIGMVINPFGEKRVYEVMLAHLRETGRAVVEGDPDSVMYPQDPFFLYNGQIANQQIHGHYNVKLKRKFT